MKSQQIRKIRDILAILSGQPLRFVFRFLDMTCLEFGDIIVKKVMGRDAAGKAAFIDENGGKYALHLQCNFRISSGNEIVMARGDMYEPNSSLEAEVADDDVAFDWSHPGNNRLDELIKRYFSEPVDVAVDHVSVGKLGDITIKLSNGYIIEVFTDVSGAEECWRFFEADAEGDLIVNGLGIDEDPIL